MTVKSSHVQWTSSDSGDGDVWDAVVGIRGQFELSGRWFMPFHLDVGTGDSDVTWQTTAGSATGSINSK